MENLWRTPYQLLKPSEACNLHSGNLMLGRCRTGYRYQDYGYIDELIAGNKRPTKRGDDTTQVQLTDNSKDLLN